MHLIVIDDDPIEVVASALRDSGSYERVTVLACSAGVLPAVSKAIREGGDSRDVGFVVVGGGDAVVIQRLLRVPYPVVVIGRDAGDLGSSPYLRVLGGSVTVNEVNAALSSIEGVGTVFPVIDDVPVYEGDGTGSPAVPAVRDVGPGREPPRGDVGGQVAEPDVGKPVVGKPSVEGGLGLAAEVPRPAARRLATRPPWETGDGEGSDVADATASATSAVTFSGGPLLEEGAVPVGLVSSPPPAVPVEAADGWGDDDGWGDSGTAGVAPGYGAGSRGPVWAGEEGVSSEVGPQAAAGPLFDKDDDDEDGDDDKDDGGDGDDDKDDGGDGGGDGDGGGVGAPRGVSTVLAPSVLGGGGEGERPAASPLFDDDDEDATVVAPWETAGAATQARRAEAVPPWLGGDRRQAAGPFLSWDDDGDDDVVQQPDSPARAAPSPWDDDGDGNPAVEAGGVPGREAATDLPEDLRPAAMAYTLPGRGHRGRCIAIVAAKGGSGKSTQSLHLTANLSMAIAPEGKRVAYVDGDMHKGDILKRLQMPDNVPTINDLQDVGAVTADAVHRVIVTLKDYHLDVVLAPPTHPGSRGMPLQAVRLYTRVVQRLLEEYDYVVIDTPQAASRGEGESPIFRNFVNVVADMQIVILEPDVSTVDDIRHHLMRTTNPRFAPSPDEVISADRFGYVLNKARPGINMTVEDVRQMMGAMWAYLGEIPAVFDAIQAAANQGELLTTDPEFTRALRTILWKATAEPALRPDVGQQSEAAGRRLSRLRRRR